MLTVFQRKEFGNEKIYERRINVGKNPFEVLNLELNEQTNFIRMGIEVTLPKK